MILPYCIVADSAVSVPNSGIRETPIKEIGYHGLRCFYSRFARKPAAFSKEDALQFHDTLHAFFDQAAVIPFRFPTMLESQEKLQNFLEEKSAVYSAALRRLRDLVQMELRIASAERAPAKKTSGKDYMTKRLATKQSLESAAAAARAAVHDLFVEWRQREAREGLRCYALVGRSNVAQFENKMNMLALNNDVQVFVSGPWPATEFIE